MPQKAWLPNGRSFLARYKRGSRRNLPRNMTTARTRQIGPRHQRKRRAQQGGSFLETIAKLGTKALTSTGILKKGLGVGVRALNSQIGNNW